MKVLTLFLVLFLYSCGTGSENGKISSDIESREINESTIAQEQSSNSLPSLNLTKNKSMKITISDCDFDKIESLENTIYLSSLQNGEVKLILGSLLSCDYKNGAFIKELSNKPDILSFEIFQKGNRLSNECKCYFYYEITIKNKTSIPESIFIGDELFTVDKRRIITEIALQEIRSKLK